MSSDLVFCRQLASALAQGPTVVAMVIHTSGSVPREVGAKLLVDATQQPWGTIGGGAGEAKVLQRAKEVLTSGKKQLVTIDLSGVPERDIQGICGGQMQVWLERWSGQGMMRLVDHMLEKLGNGQAVTLMVPLGQGQSPYIMQSGCLESGVANGAAAEVNSEAVVDRFRTTLRPSPTLLIVGAGHCGIQLARVADLAGFQVIVQDDRVDWANAENFPQAVSLFTAPISSAIASLANYSELYVALVTRGFDYDLAALQALLNSPIAYRYVGMIGSRKRVRQVLSAPQLAGRPQQDWQHFYAPIGLDIGALTPEEIAVSICAELIMVRRGGTGTPLTLSWPAPG
jgi:xanthine dehydrogenase accessory factor